MALTLSTCCVQARMLSAVLEDLSVCGGVVRVSAQLLDGFLRLLRDLNWGCLAVEAGVCQVLGMCQHVVGQGQLESATFAPGDICCFLGRILATCGNIPLPIPSLPFCNGRQHAGDWWRQYP
jgi:hypothetical protein